jgi:two-component sensor histidine kinase
MTDGTSTPLTRTARPLALRGEAEPPAVRSLRWHLVVLCAGIALPVLGFLAVLLWQSASAERTRLEREGLLAARTVAVDIDRDITTLTGTLQALSYSLSLQGGDLATFHAVASRLAQTLELAVVLFDRSGRQLVNTRRAFGEPLPLVHAEVRRGVPTLLETRKPYVTDVFTGQIANEPVFVIMVPVFRAGGEEILYLLQLSIPVERTRGIILSTVRPEQGLALVADRKNVTLARNRLSEQFEALEAKTLTGAVPLGDNRFRSVTAAGTPVTAFTAPLPDLGWTVVVGIEEEALRRPVLELMRLLLATGALLLLLSAGLAALVGRRIMGSLDSLVRSAAALGSPGPLPAVRTSIREINAVGDAHARAALDLRDALNAKEALLYEVNHRVKNSLAVVTSLLALQARQSSDPALKERLSEVRARVGVVAGLHQRLYESGRHDRLDVGPLLAAVAADTVRAYGAEDRIGLDLDVQEGIVLKINDATPLVLLVAELLTNAAKHAFPEGRPGRIALALSREGSGLVHVTVADDGRGLPEGVDPLRSASTGMRIVSALTRQLRAELGVAPGDPGTRYSITFTPSD